MNPMTTSQGSAQRLPAIVAGERASGEQMKVLTFNVGSEVYALPIDAIKEIIEFGGVTRVPMAPAYIRGVINLRGSVVPVVDLAARLGRRGGATGRRTCIVIVEVADGDDRLDVGIVVDAVNEVLDIAADAVEPAPSFGATIRVEFIRGMAKVKNRFVVILHHANVLSVSELAMFGE